MRRRLYVNLYLALLASTFVCLVVAALAFRALRDSGGPPRERLRRAAVSLTEALPAGPRGAGTEELLRRWASDQRVEVVVGDADGPIAGVPSADVFAVPPRPVLGWHRQPGGPMLVTPLDGGGWAAIRLHGPHRASSRVHPFFMALAILAVVMAIGSYPVARRVTRRLEGLTETVKRWGEGDLGSRAGVSGNDEVAVLAATFNGAAERIDALLAQERSMLANASHELRSPLARLRMALELVTEERDAERRQELVKEIHRDIVELDGLIEDFLLMSRANTRVPGRPFTEVDMEALLQEEANRVGARFSIQQPVQAGSLPSGAADGAWTLSGDPVLLRHMIRNLLENARSHGGGEGTTAELGRDGAGLRLTIGDRGPGVPVEDRERIFAPFYRRSADGSDARTRGTDGHGLGLALVRQVARLHGGDVVYRAGHPEGSCFDVTLPFAAGPSAPRETKVLSA